MGVQPVKPTRKPDTWVLDTLFLSLCIGALFFIFAGTRPLLAPDEGRYAEIAREMVTSGNYVTPYLNGIKYFEKPVLFYWLEAGAIKSFGLGIWSLRSVNVLCGLLGCLLTYFTARILYDRKTGLLAAFILGTSMLYFAMTHMISLDLPVTVFLSACLYALLLGINAPYGRERRNYVWLAAAASALAVLTKGLIGIVFPAMILGSWMAVTGEWRLLKKIYIPSALVIFILLAAPWHLLVNARNPEFFNYYFITQHVLRYTDKDVGHYQPVWFFVPALCLGFFPWIVFFPQMLAASLPKHWRERKNYQNELFLFLWAALIFGFFSFSKSKLISYILPVIPPLAILTARYLRHSQPRASVKISYLVLTAIALLFAYVLLNFGYHTPLPDVFRAQKILLAAAGIIVAGACTGFMFAIYDMHKALHTTVITAGLFLITLLYAVPFIDTRSIQPLAAILKTRLAPGDSVVTYNQYYQDLPFYLQRRVSILNWRNELAFGMQFQDTHAWMLDDHAFMAQWHSPKRVYAIMRKEEFEGFKRFHPAAEIKVLGSTVTNVLITNSTS